MKNHKKLKLYNPSQNNNFGRLDINSFLMKNSDVDTALKNKNKNHLVLKYKYMNKNFKKRVSFTFC